MTTRRFPASPKCSGATAHCGFTLAELVVALVLLGCGALALIAASATAARGIGLAEAQERANAAARHRVERIASGECSAMRDGAFVDSVLGIRERWTITNGRGTRLVTDSVAPLESADEGRVVLSRLVLC
jgi:Tfp pilus assembly protein PilV